MAVRIYPFHSFVIFVRTKSRHVLDTQNAQFLGDVLDLSANRLATFPAGETFYRSQIAHADGVKEVGVGSYNLRIDIDLPAENWRMLPWKDRAKEGRANSKGVPVLYCATTRDTAIAEVRPWIGARITVATLSLRRQATVVDCSAVDKPKSLFDIKTQEDAKDYLWSLINDAFAEPVTVSDDTADYAPTQFLADAFRQHGYDGIKYRSRVGDGHNIALFNLDAVEITSRELYGVQGLSVKSQLIIH